MKAVVDTNVLVSGIFWSGVPSRVLELWVDGAFELVASADVVDEYTRVLGEIGRRYGRHDLAQSWSSFIFQNAKIVEAKAEFKKCRDPFDNKFVDCAVSAEAQAIISGDDDLLSLGHVGEIPILSCKQAISFFTMSI